MSTGGTMDAGAASTASTRSTGATAVVSALAELGVDTIFGIPGTHNLELYRHLREFGIRAVTPRHEQGAGYAADGYHLVTGRPGVVLTTSGPGLTNVITAAATAYAESRPMIVLSPGVPTGTERLDAGMLHETKDSSRALADLLVWSRRPRSAEAARLAVHDAFELFARGRPGPVHIEIPLDVLDEDWTPAVVRPDPRTVRAGGAAGTGRGRSGTGSELSGTGPDRPAVSDIARTTLREAFAGAAAPLVIAGGGARGTGDRLARLVEATGAHVVTTANGKGVLSEHHPQSLGANIRWPGIQRRAREADLLLVIGSEVADSDLWGGGLEPQDGDEAPASRTVIRVDIDPDQLHKNLRADLGLCLDAADFLDDLLEILEAPAAAESDPDPAEALARLASQAPVELPGDGLNARICRAVYAGAGPDVVVAGDSSQITYDGAVHFLPAARSGQLLYMPGFATLGYGIPAAIGAKIADPALPVVALVGDGAAMFSIQEVVTAVELGLPIPFIVVDNGGYREIAEQMTARGIAPFAVDLHRPDFPALSRAMGARGEALDAGDPGLHGTLSGLVAEALRADGPTVILVSAVGADRDEE